MTTTYFAPARLRPPGSLAARLAGDLHDPAPRRVRKVSRAIAARVAAGGDGAGPLDRRAGHGSSLARAHAGNSDPVCWVVTAARAN